MGIRMRSPTLSGRFPFFLALAAGSFALLAVACGGDDAPADPLPDTDASVVDGSLADGSRADGSTTTDGGTTTDSGRDTGTDATTTTDGGDAGRTDAGDGGTTTDGSTTDGSTTSDAGDGGSATSVSGFVIDLILNGTNDTSSPSTRPFEAPDLTDREDQADYAVLF
ncbi:MAG: hypothetical protein U0169_17910 [Polyangiaceae bacterium]